MSNPSKFEGRSSDMKKDTPWLSSEDLDGLGDVSVEIQEVYRHQDVEFDAGRKEKFVYSLAFKGSKKQLVLNATNRHTLVTKFGVNVKEWSGKKVTLFVLDGVKLAGKLVKGIRIK